MELDDTIDSKQKRRQIGVSAGEAIKDGLHIMSNATIDQAEKDNWGSDMYPYNRDDETPLFYLLAKENQVEKVNPVESNETT